MGGWGRWWNILRKKKEKNCYRAHCHAPVQKLGNIVRGIKMIVAKRMKIEGRINTPIWQRNYYERIIRNKWEMERIRRYILYNPKKYKSPCETGALFSY